jgi:hypothetical protein
VSTGRGLALPLAPAAHRRLGGHDHRPQKPPRARPAGKGRS